MQTSNSSIWEAEVEGTSFLSSVIFKTTTRWHNLLTDYIKTISPEGPNRLVKQSDKLAEIIFILQIKIMLKLTNISALENVAEFYFIKHKAALPLVRLTVVTLSQTCPLLSIPTLPTTISLPKT